MLLYRFLNQEHGLEALQHRNWKVSRLLELNDPADCQPTLVGGPSQSSEVAKREFDRDYLKVFYENIGMVCLSASVDDPVLWSHYADGHRGMAIGHEFAVEFPNIHAVKYQEDRPSINHDELEKLRPNGVASGEFVTRLITDAFTRKAPSWAYEKEYRFFCYLSGCKMIGRHYFFDLPGSFPTVILGNRCSLTPSDIQRAYKRNVRVIPNERIGRANFDPKKYSMSIDFPPPPTPPAPEAKQPITNAGESSSDDTSTPMDTARSETPLP